MAQSNLESRLAYALIELSDFFGFEEDGQTLAVNIKRRELASMSSMTTANAIRTLSKLKKEGVIGVEKKSITIIDKKQLASLV